MRSTQEQTVNNSTKVNSLTVSETVNIVTKVTILTVSKLSKLQIFMLESIGIWTGPGHLNHINTHFVSYAARKKYPDLTYAAISRSIKRLEKRRMIQRAHPFKWSKMEIELTEAGRAYLKSKEASE